MPRSRFLGQREPLPDVRFRDKVVGKFLNILMEGGKKSTAERICYGAFDVIQEKTGGDPLKVFKSAIDNVKPIVEVKSRRVGGASYQVPVEIRPARRMSLALRWLSEYARTRGGKSIVNLPYTQECNDVAMMLIQHHKASEYFDRAIDQFEQLYRDARDGARVMALVVHPYIMGAPHRLKYFRNALAHIRGHQDVACWTGEQILDWYLAQ